MTLIGQIFADNIILKICDHLLNQCMQHASVFYSIPHHLLLNPAFPRMSLSTRQEVFVIE